MTSGDGVRPRFVLGSASPRRFELLDSIGVRPDDVRPPDIDESPLRRELPAAYCRRITRAKVEAVTADPADVVLCADTTVALGRRILGKPADAGAAAEFLYMLSGRRHRVVTCVAVKRGDTVLERSVDSRVQFKRLGDLEVNAYLASGEWEGKAGGYAIQGLAATFVPWISGSHSAIVGLPLCETAALLTALGYPVHGAPA